MTKAAKALSYGDLRALMREHVVRVDHAAGLAAVHQPDVNLAIWARRLPAATARFARELVGHRIVEQHKTRAPLALRFAQDLVGSLSHAQSLGRQAFAHDLAQLIKLYAVLTGEDRVSVRLETVTSNSCSHFHVDWVRLRLITTYIGRGTEFLPEHAADRAALVHNPEAVCRDAQAVGVVPSEAVGVFKGSSYPGLSGGGVIHRSPHIEARGERRLLFVIDAG